MLMLPPPPPPVTGEVPVLLIMVTFDELRSPLNVVPLSSPPDAATVKSVGSISQVPVLPVAEMCIRDRQIVEDRSGEEVSLALDILEAELDRFMKSLAVAIQ